MDFIDVLKQFSERAAKLKDQIQTEEATKTSLIMPFFQQVLGYDVFNPDEFVPEYIADVGIKKGEKVDYAICFEGKPAILIEAKWCGDALDGHDSQLFRYFGTSKAKFAILTNGLTYKFYTDLEEQNKMDLQPFLEADLLNIRDNIVPALKKFCKNTFNVDEILSNASELKYSTEIKKFFAQQISSPTPDFVKFVLSNTYSGLKTQTVIEKFTPLVKNALNNYINELMNDRITAALKSEPRTETETAPKTEQDTPEAPPEIESRIHTTADEIQSYFIIKAILSEAADVSKIKYKDTTAYFVIYYDKQTQWICRLRLERANKYICFPGDTFPSGSRREIRHQLNSLDDIFEYKDMIKSVASAFISNE